MKHIFSIVVRNPVKILGFLILMSFAACSESGMREEYTLCTELKKAHTAIPYLIQANKNFRSNIQIQLMQMCKEYNLPELVNDFVMVNPAGCWTSPVAITKEATEASIADLEKGKTIVLAYFNLPDDSEISSGLYQLYVNKTEENWNAELRNPEGETVLNKTPEVEVNTFGKEFCGRSLFISEGRLEVRFGAQLKEISFYIDVEVGTSENILIPAEDYAGKLTKEILKFRKKVEGQIQSTFPQSHEIFVATRSDALLISALTYSNGAVVPVMFIASPNIPADFYTASGTGKIQGMYSDNTFSVTYTDLPAIDVEKGGGIGGMLGGFIYSGYVVNSTSGIYQIPL